MFCLDTKINAIHFCQCITAKTASRYEFTKFSASIPVFFINIHISSDTVYKQPLLKTRIAPSPYICQWSAWLIWCLQNGAAVRNTFFTRELFALESRKTLPFCLSSPMLEIQKCIFLKRIFERLQIWWKSISILDWVELCVYSKFKTLLYLKSPVHTF